MMKHGRHVLLLWKSAYHTHLAHWVHLGELLHYTFDSLWVVADIQVYIWELFTVSENMTEIFIWDSFKSARLLCSHPSLPRLMRYRNSKLVKHFFDNFLICLSIVLSSDLYQLWVHFTRSNENLVLNHCRSDNARHPILDDSCFFWGYLLESRSKHFHMIITDRSYGTYLRMLNDVGSIKSASHTAFQHGIVDLLLSELHKGYHCDNFKESQVELLLLYCIKNLWSVLYYFLLSNLFWVYSNSLPKSRDVRWYK